MNSKYTLRFCLTFLENDHFKWSKYSLTICLTFQRSVVDAIKDATKDKPWIWAVILIVVVLPLVLLIAYCCMGGKSEVRLCRSLFVMMVGMKSHGSSFIAKHLERVQYAEHHLIRITDIPTSISF